MRRKVSSFRVCPPPPQRKSYFQRKELDTIELVYRYCLRELHEKLPSSAAYKRASPPPPTACASELRVPTISAPEFLSRHRRYLKLPSAVYSLCALRFQLVVRAA